MKCAAAHQGFISFHAAHRHFMFRQEYFTCRVAGYFITFDILLYDTHGRKKVVSLHVQCELRRRKSIGNVASASCFSGRIVCGNCGSIYGSKVWHSTSKYRRTIWQCNRKFSGGEKCATPHLYEKEIQRIFLEFVNSLITDRRGILAGLNEALMSIDDNVALERERDTLQDECEVLMKLMRKTVQKNARSAQNHIDYKVKYGGMSERYEKAGKRLAEVSKSIAARNAKRSELESFLTLLDGREEL